MGAGTLTLTGANTYSGVTVLTQGTLTIGAGGRLSGGGVTNNAALVFARNDTLTVGNAISGTGTLTQAGSGTLILTGANTHAGLTTINAGGTVQVGDGGTSGQVSGGAVLNNGALVVNRGDAVTLANAISGSGTLTQAGVGTLTLTGANTYTGGTTIASGSTLRLEAGGSLGSGTVGNAGMLVLNRAGDVTLAQNISGGGTLTQAGGGTLTITGHYAQTATNITAGTLRFSGDRSLSTGAVTNDGVLIFNRSDYVLPGAISGTGRVEILSGTVALGSATHTGGTLVAAGATLQVGSFINGGTLAGAVVNHGTVRYGDGGPVSVGVVSNTFSGSGRLILAAQDIVLTGNNSHTGGTILAPTATVTVGDGGTAGSLGGGVVEMQAASLSFNRADTVVVANPITGQGRLTQGGSGTLVLTGANDFAGQTRVTQGVLQIGDGGTSGTLGTSAIAIAAGSRLAFNRADTITVANVISGAGETHQIGTGTLTLTGSYVQQATVISAGTLRFTGGEAPFAPGMISNNGILVLNRTDAVQLEGVSGTGRMEIASGAVSFSPTAVATQAGGFRIAAGASLGIDVLLSIPVGGLPNLSGGSIVADGTLRVGAPGDGMLMVGQSISGTGVLRIEAQDAYLTSRNSFSGTTVILGGLTAGEGNLGTSRVELQGGLLRFNTGRADSVANAITGEGTVRHSDVGTTILTGANSYAGRTEINRGTLQIGDGGTSGSLGSSVVSIAGGARLAFNRSDSFTFPNVISGAGELRQIGPGTTILAGANTYSGLTTISAGVLQIGPGGQLGSGAVVNDAILAFNRPDAITVANPISGTGALHQIGTGTTLLAGENTHGGGNVIAAGALSAGADTHLGAASGGVGFQGGTLIARQSFTAARATTLGTAGGALAPDAGVTLTWNGPISGAGSLAMNGAGTLILGGVGTHAGGTSVNTGTLMLAPGGRLGPGALSVASGALFDMSRIAAPSQAVASLAGGGVVALGARNLTITGGGTVFSGSLNDGGAGGSLTIAGGTTTLTGASRFGGPAIVNAGMLVVNGTLGGTSGVIVNGGTLGGSGTIPGLVVAAGGSLAPGNSIGTLEIAGNLTLAAGSTTVIEVQGSEADRINVTGRAALGGTLRLVPLGGPYVFNAPYTLIRAASVSGQFAAVSTEGSFGAGVIPRVSNTAEQVELRLTPAPLSGAGSRNSQAVADGLNAAVAGGADVSPLFALYNLPAAALPRGLSQLSGEVHVAAGRAGLESSGQLLGLLLDPWRPRGEAVGAIRLWAGGFGAGGRRGGDGASRVTGGGGGVAAGAEMRVATGLTLGFALAGAGTQVSLAQGLGRAESNQIHGALYGRAEQGAFRLSAALSFGGADLNTRRQVGFLGPGNLEGRATSTGLALRVEGGWAWQAPIGLTLTPGIAFQGGWFDTPDTTERATGPLAPAILAVGGRQSQSRIELGLRADTAVTARLAAFGRVAWASYMQRDAAAGARFASLPGSNFEVAGARPDRQAALLAAGLDWRVCDAWSLTARLDAELSGTTTLVGGSARLRYAF